MSKSLYEPVVAMESVDLVVIGAGKYCDNKDILVSRCDGF